VIRVAYSLNYNQPTKAGEVADVVFLKLMGYERGDRSSEGGLVDGKHRLYVACDQLGPHCEPHIFVEVQDGTMRDSDTGTRFLVDAWHPDNKADVESAVKKVRRTLKGH